MNQIGMKGIAFVEFTGPEIQNVGNILKDFGFACEGEHKAKKIKHLRQNGIHLFLNGEPGSFAKKFADIHGPSISSMGWVFSDAKAAFELAVSRGARPCAESDYPAPAIWGIGESLIYFMDERSCQNHFASLGFKQLENPEKLTNKGFLLIDHLTNNVPKGTMQDWSNFYKNVFEFSEVRYFDIRGQKTGLKSFALKSPDGSFCIPINEGTEKKSQINEYLEEYGGPGVQHLAFLTGDILSSLDALKGSRIEMLDIDNSYYQEVFNRVPNVTEDKKRIQEHNVLVDGDEEGYLLQIFTRNLFGPIFIEIIQRKNHHSFGEGNFKALFDSIERDQARRGYL